MTEAVDMASTIEDWADEVGPDDEALLGGEELLEAPGDEAAMAADDGEDPPEGDDEEEAEPPPAAARAEAGAVDEVEDDDVEVSLDVILRERLQGEAGYEEEPEAERPVALEDDDAVRPRADDEFLCQSCFLVKLRVQMADADGSRCRDCAMAFA